MRPDQLRMNEVLKDPVYRKFFTRPPRLYQPQLIPSAKPWWLYVQRKEEGPWARRACLNYEEAFSLVKKVRERGDHDFTIVSRRVSYRPPPDYKWPQSHSWCPYCRRPTVFWYFRSHHALRQFRSLDLSNVARCTICGISETDTKVWDLQKAAAS